MNVKLCKLLRKFELLTFGTDMSGLDIDNIFNDIKNIYPQSKIPSKEEAIEYIKRVSPYFIYKYILQANSIKSCSSISFAFAEQASMDGFATVTREIPGHYYNVMMTKDGLLAIDLSAIQFEWASLAKLFESTDIDPYGEERAKKELLKQVKKNPFRAIKIWKDDSLKNILTPKGKNLLGEVKTFNFDLYDRIIKEDNPDYGEHSDFSQIEK